LQIERLSAGDEPVLWGDWSGNTVRICR